MEFSPLFVSRISVKENLPKDRFYSSLPTVVRLAQQEIELSKRVTFLVGENGIGKSTLVEAIAVAMGFNPEGGTRNFRFSTNDSHSDLFSFLTISKGIQAPKDGFFLRAESFYNAASYIDRMTLRSLLCNNLINGAVTAPYPIGTTF